MPIRPSARFDEDLTFSVELLEPKGFGVKLGRIHLATVTLTNDSEFKAMVDKFAEMMKYQSDAMKIGNLSW